MLLYLILILIALVSYTILKPLLYWRIKGVNYLPGLPIIGNLLKPALGLQTAFDAMAEIYNNYPNERYFGAFYFHKPVLVIKDLDLIKTILIQKFSTFTDHIPICDIETDYVLSENVLFTEGEKWKTIRHSLNPFFRVDNLNEMHNYINSVALEYTEYFLEKTEKTIKIDTIDVFSRYANDIIAISAFSYKCNSLKENNENFFILMNKTKLDGPMLLKFVLLHIMPNICKLLKIKAFDDNSIKALIEIMQKNKNKHDLKNLLNNNKSTETFSDLYMATQALTFYLAGFESISNLLSFMAIELALHQNVQNRLIEEIDEAFEKKNEISYDDVKKLEYLDMVFKESLRMHPPSPVTTRVCNSNFTIPQKDNSKSLTLKEGDAIVIPIYGLLMDSKYFPDPHTFDPNRFSNENKKNIPSSAYIPFGLGPRACIGIRFAYLEIKLLIVNLLRRFRFVPIGGETSLELLSDQLRMVPKSGWTIGLERR